MKGRTARSFIGFLPTLLLILLLLLLLGQDGHFGLGRVNALECGTTKIARNIDSIDDDNGNGNRNDHDTNNNSLLSASLSSVCFHFGGIENPQSSNKGYHSWYNNNDIANKYPNYVFLPSANPETPENGVAVHWRIGDEDTNDEDSDIDDNNNDNNNYLYMAVATRAKGWVGFGIGEAGGMLGADMVLFTASKPTELVDAYTTDIRQPHIDDCSPNDWEFINSNIDEENGFIMFETKRLLDTGDPQDRIISNGKNNNNNGDDDDDDDDDDASLSSMIPAHRVIAAWGDTPDEVSYHGLNRARGAIHFFGQQDDDDGGDDEVTRFQKEMNRIAEGSFEIRSINHEIQAVDTEYFHTCVSRDDLINGQHVRNSARHNDDDDNDDNDKLHLVGFEPMLFEDTKVFIHHFLVYASRDPTCDDEDSFIDIVYVWAPGEGPLAFPDNFGSPMFGSDGHQSFMIEIHYNNPSLQTGFIDSSGVRFYWTSQPRSEEVGILAVGDPFLGLYGQPVGDGLTRHEFYCPSSCSSSLVSQPVKVLREYLHMHKTGVRVTNEQIRNGTVIRSASLDYWEFDQNGNAAVLQNPFVIQPGDAFRTSCYYFNNNNNNNSEDNTVFGLSSQEEMCMAFLYYYPRVTTTTTIKQQQQQQQQQQQKRIGDDNESNNISWICGIDIGYEMCEVIYRNETLHDKSDLNRTFGNKMDPCD